MKRFPPLLRSLAVLLGAALLFACQKPDIGGPDDSGGKPGKTIPVESVKLDVSAKELIPGETLQLKATLLPENATNKDEYTLVWNSSAPGVAKVSDTGLVTALVEGSATISVSFTADIMARCEITVKNPDRVSGIISADDFGQAGESTPDDKEAGYDFAYQFTPRAALASDEAMRSVSDVWTDGRNYRFSLPATKDPFYGNSSCVNTDDIIVFRDSETFPGGAAIKIVSSDAAQKNDGTAESFTYQGYQVPIEEVFNSLHLETSQLPLGDVRRIVDEEGKPVEYTATKAGGGFEIAIPELFGDNFTASLNLGDNLSITPKMRIGFTMDVAADIVDCKLTYARARVEANADLSCDLTFKASVEKEFKSKRLMVYLGAIPIGPVVISPVVSMEFVVKLSGQVDLTFSVAYQKGVYAHAFYNGDRLQCRVGETTPTDPKDPFSVTGNMSGAVEFGPNLGMGISLYGGALALGVDFDPHMVYTVFSSYPISLEGLKNIGNGYFWLTEAGFEPSLAFSFGGYIQAAYAWSMDFQVPEELGLSYSFGKTYVVPKVDGPIECVPERTSAAFVTHIKNKAMFDNNIYLKVREADDPSHTWKEVPFTLSGAPNNEETVEGTAIFSPMKPFQKYEAIGPFMKISLFGQEIEVLMDRNYSHTFYALDEETDKAIRTLLTDIYACGDGNWKDCNWTDPDVPFYKLKNILFTYASDQEAAAYSDIEGYCRKKLAITVPASWKMGSNLRIKDCTSPLDDLEWSLNMYGGVVFDTIEIEDPNFLTAYGDDSEEFGYFHHIWPARSRLVIHSKRFGGSFRPTINDSNASLYVDLSGTYIQEFYSKDGNTTEPALSGTVLLDNCKHLSRMVIRGAKMPEKLSFTNCPKLRDVMVYDVPELSDMSTYSGTFNYLEIEDCGGSIRLGKELKIDNLIKIESGSYTDLILDGVQGGAAVRLMHGNNNVQYEGPTVPKVVLSSCPELIEFSSPGGADVESLEITGCTKIETIDVGGAFGANIDYEWTGPLKSISVSGCPSLRRVLIRSAYLNGTLPSFIQALEGKGYASYPYKYSYYVSQTPGKRLDYTTHSNGYTMPGEPGSPYRHPLGGYYDLDE